MCDVIKATFRALDYTASRTRSSRGERSELLSVVGKKRSVILLSISPVHKVVRCRALPLEKSNWTVHVSERAARLPKGHNILERIPSHPFATLPIILSHSINCMCPHYPTLNHKVCID